MALLSLSQAVAFLADENNRGKRTLCALIDDGYTLEEATQVYLYPGCFALGPTSSYQTIGWCPSKNKFVGVLLKTTSSYVVCVKLVDAFSEKQTSAEQFFQEFEAEKQRVDEAITLVCGDQLKVFRSKDLMRINGALTQILLAITHNGLIVASALQTVRESIETIANAHPQHRTKLEALLEMIDEYDATITKAHQVTRAKGVLIRYRKILETHKQRSLSRDEENFEVSEVSGVTKILFDSLKYKIASITLALANRRYVTTAEMIEGAVVHFGHLGCENLPTLVTAGLKQLVGTDCVEYISSMDAYTFTELGRRSVVEIMDQEIRAGG